MTESNAPNQAVIDGEAADLLRATKPKSVHERAVAVGNAVYAELIGLWPDEEWVAASGYTAAYRAVVEELDG